MNGSQASYGGSDGRRRPPSQFWPPNQSHSFLPRDHPNPNTLQHQQPLQQVRLGSTSQGQGSFWPSPSDHAAQRPSNHSHSSPMYAGHPRHSSAGSHAPSALRPVASSSHQLVHQDPFARSGSGPQPEYQAKPHSASQGSRSVSQGKVGNLIRQYEGQPQVG